MQKKIVLIEALEKEMKATTYLHPSNTGMRIGMNITGYLLL